MKADPLTEEEKERLWRSGVLGTSLNYTIFYLISQQQFGTRGHHEQHQIRIDDLKLYEMLLWDRFPTLSGRRSHQDKTRQGGLKK